MNNEHQSGPATLAPSSSARPQQPNAGAKDVIGKAGDAASKLSEIAKQAGQQATETATSLASEANEKAKGLMNQQIAAGASLVGHVAEATKAAAEKLNQDAPQLSEFVRDAAGKVERLSRNLKDQSVEDLYRSASEFTRRQPAVVFGSAALFGFFIFRLLKASSNNAPAFGESERFSHDHPSAHSHGA